MNIKRFFRSKIRNGLQMETLLHLNMKVHQNEEIVFLGWMKVEKIQGLDKLRKYNIKAVCGSGTGRTAEPDAETVIAQRYLYARISAFTPLGLLQ